MANTVNCENNQSMEEENDLEDGEIEDDEEEEEIVQIKESNDANHEKQSESINSDVIIIEQNKNENNDSNKSDSHKSHRERKSERHHKHDKSGRKRASAENEDDWAGNVEKAIASIMKKEKINEDDKSDHESSDEKKRGKKRRRRDKDREKKKKRKKSSEEKHETAQYNSPIPDDEIDEDEMLCIRGGSPKPTAASLVTQPIYDDDNPYANQFEIYESGSSEYDSDYQRLFSSSHDKRSEKDRDRKRDRRQRDGSKRERKNKSDKNRDRRAEKNRPVLQDANSICLFYMQGKCQKKSEECQYSHAAMPPMKLELCKFYLMDCCAKRDKCLYMHSEFPCKYYHTGLRCIQGERGQCKFAHGAPLNDNLKQILLKHLETAPKELLGDFPRLSREGAQSLVNATQNRLENQFNADGSIKPPIPSLFDINVSIPKELVSNLNDQENKQSENNDQQKPKTRSRPSRWGSEKEQVDVKQLMLQINQNKLLNLPTTGVAASSSSVSVNTVTPVNTIGQINSSIFDTLNAQDQQKIQMYNMSFNFPGFYSDKGDKDMRVVSNGDIDMRALPQVIPPSNTCDNKIETSKSNTHHDNNSKHSDKKDSHNQDIEKTEAEKALTDQDMRQLLPTPITASIISADQIPLSNCKTYIPSETNLDIGNTTEEERDLEIDEPPEDEPLKIDMKEEEENNETSQSVADLSIDDHLPSHLPQKQRELFMRIKAQQKENVLHDEQKTSDNETHKDDDWYSDDEDDDDEDNNTPLSHVLKKLDDSKSKLTSEKIPPLQDVDLRPTEIKQAVVEPLTLPSGNIMNALSELSKVDISAEVTKLLSLVKNQANQSQQQNNTDNISDVGSSSKNESSNNSSVVQSSKSSSGPVDPRKPRDPRQQTDSSKKESAISDPRVKRKSSSDSRESITSGNRYHTKISVYEMAKIDSVNSNIQSPSRRDTDLRNLMDVQTKDLDLRVSNFGDTDLRPGGRSDVDLRQLNLPFKPMQNYVPATEIDASINSHPPIVYRVQICDIPRPDYSGLKLNPADAQTSADPRIRKIFRLSAAKVPNEIASPDSLTTSPKHIPSSMTSPKGSNNHSSVSHSSSSTSSRIDPRMQRKLNDTSFEMDSTSNSNLDHNQQMQLLQNSQFYQGLNNNQKLILTQALTTQKLDMSNNTSLPNDPILSAILANLGLSPQQQQPQHNLNTMLNPALSLMSLLNSGNFNQNQMQMPPSLLGPGPMSAPNNMMGPSPSNEFSMTMPHGGFGGPGGNHSGPGLLGPSPYQNNMGGGGFMGNFGDSGDGGFQFNNGPPFFSGDMNKRNDSMGGNFRGNDRKNRRGGGMWNSGGGNRRGGNFHQSKNSRINTKQNRSRTPP